MSAWLLVMWTFTAGVTYSVPGIESEAECHRVAAEVVKLRGAGLRHGCIEYFVAAKP